MALKIVEEAALTDVGRQRSANEDAYFATAPMFAVADGMGGARAGEVASSMAVESIEGWQDGGSPEDALRSVIEEANRRIHELSRSDESRAGMGTTLTAVVAGEHDVSIGHVGDSRAYVFRDDDLTRMTDDHSLVEELRRQGKITAEEAETHPQRSIITRALGPEGHVEVETFSAPAKPGDTYLLCSDGLTSMVGEPRIGEIMRGGSSLESIARQLVDEANSNGGRDNVTVVLFRLGEDVAEDADTDTLAGGETAAISVTDVEAAQAAAPDATAIIRPGEGQSPPPESGTASPLRPPPPRSRPRKLIGALLALFVIGALAVGVYAGSRQFYFVGTDDQGLVTLYRGLPYDGPLGIELYSGEYGTAVPARTLQAAQRERVLDHQLRGKGDATDLVTQIEERRLR